MSASKEFEVPTSRTSSSDLLAATVTVTSFGHKFGTPGADHVLNPREVANPGKEYGDSTGLNKKVREQVFQEPKALDLVTEGVRLAQEASKEEPFHLGVGCDRGRHRSVAIVVETMTELRKKGPEVTVVHRDI
jgi:RNase adaptor protein for sRNA GlmZ degradation